MSYKVKRLDSRYNGYPSFSHMIQPDRIIPNASYTTVQARYNEFIAMREWFWITFGPSRELKFYRAADPVCADLGWAWDSEHHLRIYVQEKELNWFLLKWTQ